jgi:hypothetical protein
VQDEKTKVTGLTAQITALSRQLADQHTKDTALTDDNTSINRQLADERGKVTVLTNQNAGLTRQLAQVQHEFNIQRSLTPPIRPSISTSSPQPALRKFEGRNLIISNGVGSEPIDACAQQYPGKAYCFASGEINIW